MGEAIISVENLGKCYQVGKERQQGYTALRDVIAHKAKRIFKGGLKNFQSRHTEDFWALKDVNFEIKQGEAVGIIGRNGAGKSTLLKLLSRITEPTTGRIILNGRVASLLEVGTGFHPELTGRENIYLNGSILGMSRKEIKSKFDEIVDFSGVEKFLDTPVKRYSSGMYVRLAFAVAAHLEPEILVVDEVLAVGDAEFQKKCLGKMSDVAKAGRTVLFVSHNIDAISTLTNKGLLLSKGNMTFYGDTKEAIKRYMSQGSNDFIYKNTASSKEIYIREISAQPAGYIHNDSIIVNIIIFSKRIEKNALLGIGIYNIYGQYVGNRLVENALNLDEGLNSFKVSIDNHNLVPNDYKFGIGLANNKTFDTYDAVVGEPGFTIFNDENNSFLLSMWKKQWGDHYFSDVKIEKIN